MGLLRVHTRLVPSGNTCVKAQNQINQLPMVYDVYVGFMLFIKPPNHHRPMVFSGDPSHQPGARLGDLQDLAAKFEAAANLIAKGTPTKGSASTDATRPAFYGFRPSIQMPLRSPSAKPGIEITAGCWIS